MLFPICTSTTLSNTGDNFKLTFYPPSCVHIQVKNPESDEFSLLHVIDDVLDGFMGKSPKTPMTELSGKYGPEYDGNTFLLVRKNGNCVCIFDEKVVEFTPKNKIIEYNSPVGPNFVSYPYAIDEKGLIYLPMMDVILLNANGVAEPYWYYFDKSTIIKYKDGNFVSNNFAGITESYVRNSRTGWHNQCALSYIPDGTKPDYLEYSITQNGITRILSDTEFQDIMIEYARIIDVSPMNSQTLD